MTTEAPTDGTNPTDTAATATPPVGDTLLTADPAATAAPADTTQEAAPAADAAKPAEEAKADDKPQGAPEAYADFTVPEGAAINPEVVDELKAFAKEKNLTQEEAQKLVDLGVKNAQGTVAQLDERIAQTRREWTEASRTDKEIGGDKLDENLAVAKRALDTFGTPELSKFLAETGLGSHPEITRAFFRVGQAISEDRLVPGAKAPAGKDGLAKLYPSMATH